MFNAKTVDKFLTEDHSRYIVGLISKYDYWETNSDNGFWDRRVMNVATVKDKFEPELFELIEDTTNRIKKFIENEDRKSTRLNSSH